MSQAQDTDNSVVINPSAQDEFNIQMKGGQNLRNGKNGKFLAGVPSETDSQN